jgi:predicted nucleotidyltransferase
MEYAVPKTPNQNLNILLSDLQDLREKASKSSDEVVKAGDEANRVYSLDEIKERVRPVAEKYNLPAVWVFGSYARGEATPESDVDILFDSGEIRGKQLLNVFCDFEDSIGKDCDFLTRDEVNAQKVKETSYGKSLRRNLREERVQIYG